MSYRIDLKTPDVVEPCTFEPSVRAPGKTLTVNEKDESMVVEPNGSQTRWMPRNDPEGRFDSPYTQGTVSSDGFIVYRSANGPDPGVPRAYRMIV